MTSPEVKPEYNTATATTHRLESSRASPPVYSQLRQNEVFENRKRFPSAEPSSYTFQRFWHQQTKPSSYSNHHFNSYVNQVINI